MAIAIAVVVALSLVVLGGYLTLIAVLLLVLFSARAVRARRPSPPMEATMAWPSRRARRRRLITIAIVSLVTVVCDVVAMNIVGGDAGEWAWLALVPIGLFLPVQRG